MKHAIMTDGNSSLVVNKNLPTEHSLQNFLLAGVVGVAGTADQLINIPCKTPPLLVGSR